jgi:alpha,alpha-trehalose-phosphate synthase [UDP-forming]
MKNADKRLIVVSNRLPIAIVEEEDRLAVKPGSGGLITALAPVLRDRGGVWIGWPGAPDSEQTRQLCHTYSREAGYRLCPVALSPDDVDGFYYGFSNEILWPLFHDFPMACHFDPIYWRAYQRVNDIYAREVAAQSNPEDFIWVHDYHLMLVAEALKASGQPRTTGFFLHIPFPPPDIFMKLPWRREIIQALLEFNLIGFQTNRDRNNFADCMGRLLKARFQRRGRKVFRTVDLDERDVRIGTFPISIDYNDFSRLAQQEDIQDKVRRLREAFDDRFLIFSADRLDYTKGIPQRLNALREALSTYPDLRQRIAFVQIMVPSREEVPQYQTMKESVERMISELNGAFSTPGWIPVHYVYRNLPREELVTYYSAADLAMVTPLRDGMNLVAKEYVACNVSRKGVLCLSEFSGAACEFHRYALTVNPFDITAMIAAIRQAIAMDPTESRRRMDPMRRIVSKYDIFWWVNSFLDSALSKGLDAFPHRDLDMEAYFK